MGHQNKALFALQVFPDAGTPFLIQMVRGLVNEQELILPGKQDRQHHLRSLSVAQRRKSPVQHVCVHMEKCQLPAQLPELIVRIQFFHNLQNCFFHILYLEWKVVKAFLRGDAASVFIRSHQKLQKRGLSPSVSCDKTQFPVCINLKGHVLENIVGTSLIIKRQMIDAD